MGNVLILLSIIFYMYGVVLNTLDEAKTERLREIESPPNKDELLRELRATQRALQSLERQLVTKGSNCANVQGGWPVSCR